MNTRKSIFIIGLIFLGNVLMAQMEDFPGKHWMMYSKASEAGFDEDQLSTIKQQFEDQGGSTLFVVQGGKVVVAWGEPDRRYLQASIRKSYLNALYGVFTAKGKIDIQQNLEHLGIDDIQKLTAPEKQAKVIDLLSAKSGIYLPSAFAPRGMLQRLPERGSHQPGTFWYYNNWDFNALSTIFQQQTQEDLFESFKTQIAEPLQMEDFRLFDTYFRFEKDKSIHPAYLFKMSARDMARFGLLFLREGKWKKEQILPTEWVRESTRIHTKDLGNFSNKGSYGLLWWIANPIHGNSTYYASGSGGQRIYVIPAQDMVVVHLVDTYQNRNVGEEDIQSLLRQLLQAKKGTPKPIAKLEAVDVSSPKRKTEKLVKAAAKKVVGDYSHPFLKKISIALEADQLVLQTGVGKFALQPLGDDRYMIEDIHFPVVFETGKEEQKGNARSIVNEKRIVETVILYY